MSFPSKYSSNLKIFKVVIPIIALVLSFFVMFFVMNVTVGDLPTLIYTGNIHPEKIKYTEFSPQELENRIADYEQQKNEAGIPDFPFNVIYMIMKYVTLDWGTNWATGEPILDEMFSLSGPTVWLLIASFFLISAILLPFMMLKYFTQQSHSELSRKSPGIIRIFAILSPILLLFGVSTFFMLFHGDLPQDFLTLGWRDNADPVGRLIIPAILISSMTLPFGVITLAAGASNRTVCKITFITAIFAEFSSEILFTWPGIGRYVFQALLIRNYPVIFAGVFFASLAICGALVLFELFPRVFFDNPPYTENLEHSTPQTKHTFLTKSETMIIGLLTGFLLILSLVSLLAPFHPTQDDYRIGHPSYAPPGGNFLMGTDWAGQDIFSRILYALLNIVSVQVLPTIEGFIEGVSTILQSTMSLKFGAAFDISLAMIQEIVYNLLNLYIIFAILAVVGYSAYKKTRKENHQLVILAMSLIVIVGFMALFGVLPALHDQPWNLGGEFTFVISKAYFTLVMGFPVGYILGTWIEPEKTKNTGSQWRQVFCLSLLLDFVLMEYLSFLSLGASPNQPSLGGDLNISRLVFFLYEHPFWNPFLVFILISVILAAFALIRIPGVSEKKVFETPEKRTAKIITEEEIN